MLYNRKGEPSSPCSKMNDSKGTLSNQNQILFPIIDIPWGAFLSICAEINYIENQAGYLKAHMKEHIPASALR